MSSQADCPLCGYCSRNIVVPDERWGDALNQVELERCFDDEKDFDRIHQNILEFSRTTFWCPCGRMVWMEKVGWLVSLSFIARLATTVQDRAHLVHAGQAGQRVRAADLLRQLLSDLLTPEEIARMVRAMEIS